MSSFRSYIMPLMALSAICGSSQSLPTDHYLTNISNYTFRNTKGLAETPHKLKSMEGHEDPDEWTMPSEADLDALNTRGINIDFPDFSFQEVTDKDGNTQSRQRTHTVEHVLYAMPGDAISLYPYYGLDGSYNFNENFSHWYDFNDGGRVKYFKNDGTYYDLLSFPTIRTNGYVDHDHIQISDDYGFYGGVYMSPGTKGQSENGGQYLIDHNVNNRNTNNENHCKAGTSGVFYFPKIEGINALPEEYVIAADFSQTFQLQNHIDVETKEIVEPLIAIRHLFKIRDGKAFADKVSGSLELNREYIRKNRKFVTARAGEDFQIRLSNPLPTDWGRSGGITNFYYKAADGSYKRISQFAIRVLNGDTHQLWDSGNEWAEVDFHFGADISMYRAIPESNLGLYPVNQGGFWYHTMLTSGGRGEGHYVVQVIGKDDNGQPISLKDKDGSSDWLVMMEFDITFVSSTNAFLVTEDDLYSKKEYEKGRDANLKKKYGEPIQKIDFDEYAKINGIKDNDQLRNLFLSSAKYTYSDADRANPYYDGILDATDNGKEKTFFKWPVQWDLSSYSFGYNYRHDYNMYMLATHSDNVPYHAAANGWTGNVTGDGNGLFDRLYYKTKRLSDADGGDTPVEQGYFYYVNAATDPGVSARLDFKIPCPGYRVVVSAWVAEFSPVLSDGDETSNISFNFVAVMNNGDRLTLHNFITGYLPRTGEWLNVYYSFVPRLSEFYSDTMTFDDVDHFELELAHNGKKSSGADYAIDDIRAYVVPPTADAELPEYICSDDAENMEVTLTTSFEALMQTIGLHEAYTEDQSEFSLYYAIVDKSKFDTKYKTTKDQSQAFDAAVVNLSEDNETRVIYGNVKVDSYYKGNESIKNENGSDKTLQQGVAYRNESGDGGRLITVAETLPAGSLRPGKEYYVAFKSSLGETDVPGEDPGTFFDIKGKCAYSCVISVTPNNTVKIDGVVQADASDITVCENQSPAIQVNVRSKKKVNGELKEVKNALFDWFDGTLGEFEDFTDGTSGHTLRYALQVFRAIYPEEEKLTGVEVGVTTSEEDETLEPWMIDLLRSLTEPGAKGRLPKLTLRQASFVLPCGVISDETPDRKVYVTAIPIPNEEYDENFDWCLSPTEIGVKIEHKSPLLRHGLKGMAYPIGLDDVPLRVGLEQLYADVNSNSDSRVLEIPVRLATSTDGSVKSLELEKSDVLLVQTNDPDYRHLGSVDQNGAETGQLLWIGEIESLTASTDVAAEGNRFLTSFDKDFRFKEGYFYRMRFNFKEKKESSEESMADAPVVCPGQDVFTLKIVPKYLLWRGEENFNFNNDDNWMRVHTDTLSANINTAAVEGRHRHFATNGANANQYAYAPLDFSHVVLKGDAEDPYLFKPSVKSSVIDPSVVDEEAKLKYNDFPKNGVGTATPMIQYDMAAYLSEGVLGQSETELPKIVKCKGWYANTCKEIHFRPGATIMNQQELSYKKAWVDMELDHSRWYLLSSPFKEVYAGDFYLPSDGARQATELFVPIYFDNDLNVNNRFNPAVYQRGWDKASASVYELDADDNEKDAARNVAVKSFWSHVFNDVAEQYGGGAGFSIKTDVSEMEEHRPGEGEKVLFRLPKEDEEYWYFKKDGSKNGHQTGVNRTADHYRLNDGQGFIKSTSAVAGKYFLIGNPFMTHMDIAEFLKENMACLTGKFWIVTASGQIAGVVDKDGKLTVADPTDSSRTAVAPMQGFFVESKNPTKELTLVYGEKMMRRYDSTDARLTQTTRAEESIEKLKITSFNHGVPSSATLLVPYEEDSPLMDVLAFDNRELDIPSVVYTAKAGQALSINFSAEPDETEIGVIADDDAETVLLFEGVDAFDDLFLLDKADNSLIPLEEGMEINVNGMSRGRLFLTSGVEETGLCGSIDWRLDGNVLAVSDNSMTGMLNVSAFDTLGRVVSQQSSSSGSLRVQLEEGIYVVEIRTARERKTVKVSI